MQAQQAQQQQQQSGGSTPEHPSAALEGEDVAMLFRADAGDDVAQAELGELFYTQLHYDIAHYWLNVAAQSGNADAMQWLGLLYVEGKGVQCDETLGMMWLYRAAAMGHVIASAQVNALMGSALRRAFDGDKMTPPTTWTPG